MLIVPVVKVDPVAKAGLEARKDMAVQKTDSETAKVLTVAKADLEVKKVLVAAGADEDANKHLDRLTIPYLLWANLQLAP